MSRVLATLAVFWVAIGPRLPDAGLTTGTFSLARGAIGGLVSGQTDQSFVGTGQAICFLPGTFDLTVEGDDPDGLQPSSHCGHDAVVRIAGLGEVEAGHEVARAMFIRWTDLAGRVYTLQFDGRTPGDTNQARVICIDRDAAWCRWATVDSAPRALVGADGRTFETGARARLSLVGGRDVAARRDLGVYDVPFSLTITGI